MAGEKKLSEHIADFAVGTSYQTLAAPVVAYVKTLQLLQTKDSIVN